MNFRKYIGIIFALILTCQSCSVIAEGGGEKTFEAAIAEGLSIRASVYTTNSALTKDIKGMLQSYSECAKQELDFLMENIDPQTLTEQQNYYIKGLEKQIQAFGNIVDIEQSISLWNEGKRERSRALFYMNLEGKISSLDENTIKDCRKTLGDKISEDEKIALVVEFQKSLGFVQEKDLDGKFGNKGRTRLQKCVSKYGIEIPYIDSWENFGNAFITEDLLETFQSYAIPPMKTEEKE